MKLIYKLLNKFIKEDYYSREDHRRYNKIMQENFDFLTTQFNKRIADLNYVQDKFKETYEIYFKEEKEKNIERDMRYFEHLNIVEKIMNEQNEILINIRNEIKERRIKGAREE